MTNEMLTAKDAEIYAEDGKFPSGVYDFFALFAKNSALFAVKKTSK